MWSKMFKRRGSDNQRDNSRLPAADVQSRLVDHVARPPENKGVQPSMKLRRFRSKGGDNQDANPHSSSHDPARDESTKKLARREYSELVELVQNHFKPIEELGSNATITDAKIIFLGEQHKIDTQHITYFLEHTVRDGDIILLEGYESKQAIEKENDEYLKTVKKEFMAFGWDDMSLHDKIKDKLEKRKSLIEKSNRAGLSEKLKNGLFRQGVAVAKEALAIAIGERNRSLVATVNYIREIYPEKRIFVIAGKRHFTHDSKLGKSVKEYPSYIALMTPTETQQEDLFY